MSKQDKDDVKKGAKPRRLVKAKAAEFKPGDTPYLEYDGQILNKDVPWKELVRDLLDNGHSITQIAVDIECPIRVVNQILVGNYDNLPFRNGARLVTRHCLDCPQHYSAS